MSTNQITLEQLRKKLFLLEKKEVILTGRTASKIGRRKDTMLFEVKPLNPNDMSGKRWVRLDELYEIHHSQAPPTTEEFVAAVRRAVEKGKIKND